MSGSYREFYKLATSGNNPERLAYYLEKKGRNIYNEFFADIHNFNIDRPNEDGKTALCLAAENGRLTVVQALLKAGARIDASYGPGMTPLLAAAGSHHPAVTKALILAGADVNAHDNAYLYPLHWATWHGDTDAIELLFKKGARLDVQDKEYGETPLHKAIKANRIQAVTLLVKLGANLKTCNKHGLTAGGLARHCGYAHLLPLLENPRPEAASPSLPTPEKAPVVPPPPPPKPPAGSDLPAAKDTRVWTLFGNAKIVSVDNGPALSLRLTEIFNFESRERLTLTKNTQSGTEYASAPERFENLHPATVTKALTEFVRLGGKPDDSLVKDYADSAAPHEKKGPFRL